MFNAYNIDTLKTVDLSDNMAPLNDFRHQCKRLPLRQHIYNEPKTLV